MWVRAYMRRLPRTPHPPHPPPHTTDTTKSRTLTRHRMMNQSVLAHYSDAQKTRGAHAATQRVRARAHVSSSRVPPPPRRARGLQRRRRPPRRAHSGASQAPPPGRGTQPRSESHTPPECPGAPQCSCSPCERVGTSGHWKGRVACVLHTLRERERGRAPRRARDGGEHFVHERRRTRRSRTRPRRREHL